MANKKIVCGACNSPKRDSEMMTKKMCKSCFGKRGNGKGKKGNKAK